jgi:hypothetical protein
VISKLLVWIDSAPGRTSAVAWVGFAVLIAATLLPLALGRRRPGAWWLYPGLFAAALLVATAGFRWGSVLDNEEFKNPDESQLIASAITLRHDPLYFRSIGANTCGPVDEIPLAVLAACGVRMDYRVAHLAGLGLTLCGVLATWLALRRLFGDTASRIAVLPLAAAVAFCGFHEFLHYSTEPCPSALIAVACCCLAYAWDPAGGLASLHWPLRCGLALGAVSFAKPQEVPIALVVAAGAAIMILAAAGVPLGRRLRAFGLLVLGGVAVPAVLLAAILYWGQWGEFWRSYIVYNLSYATVRMITWPEAPEGLFRMMRWSPGLRPFLFPVIGFLVLKAAAFRSAPGEWQRRMTVLSGLALLATAFAIVAPGREYYHYLSMLFLPAGLCAGCFFGSAWSSLEGRGAGRTISPWAAAGLSTLFLGLCVVPQVAWRVSTPMEYQRLYATGHSVMPVSETAREVLRHAGKDDSLAIWGWTPRLWVETGLRMGTRDGSTVRQIDENPLRIQYQERFIRDLRKNRPAVFVNAVGQDNFLKDRDASGYEQFPAIRDYIASEYRLVREVETMRVYVRRDLP